MSNTADNAPTTVTTVTDGERLVARLRQFTDEICVNPFQVFHCVSLFELEFTTQQIAQLFETSGFKCFQGIEWIPQFC